MSTDSATAIAALERGATVVTATQRLARHLRFRYDEAARAAGRRAWPSADVLPWDAWLQRLWLQTAFETARPLVLSDLEERLLWRQALAADEETLPGDADVLAGLARKTWALCLHWKVDIQRLEQRAESTDSQAFARWARRFLRACAARDRIASAGIPARLPEVLPEALRAEAGSEVWWVGFDRLPPAMADLRDALVGAGVIVNVAADDRPAGAAAHRLACADETAELVQAAYWARNRLEAEPAARIGVVVPELARRGADVRRIFLDVLVPGWQLHPQPIRPLSVSLGRSLPAYPVIRAALLACRLAVGSLGWMEASQLLRSRYLGGAEREVAGRGRADLALRQQPFLALTAAQVAAIAARPAPDLHARLLALSAVCTPDERDRPSRWAERVDGWLRLLGWPGDAGLDSDEVQAIQAWSVLLAEFGALDELVDPLPAAAAVAHLAALAADRIFEPRGAEGGIQVLGQLESGGLEFDYLWVCGLTAEAWPEPPEPNPLLSFSLQRELRMPDAFAADSLKRAEAHFAGWRAALTELVVSWPEARGEELYTMSPWLLDVPPMASAEAAARDSVTGQRSPDRHRISTSGVVEVAAADPPPPWPGDAKVPGGARVLSTQADYPARAFAEWRLGARELRRPEGPLGNIMRGNILHRLLERLYQQPECREGLGGLSASRLQEIFSAVAVPLLRRELPGPEPQLAELRRLEAERLWRRVQTLQQLDASRPPFSTQTEQHRQIALGPLPLDIRIDRVDRLADGGEFLFDYKSGNSSISGWRRDRLSDSQLPLYAQTGPVRGVAILQLAAESKVEGVAEPGLWPAAGRGLHKPSWILGREFNDWSAVVARWQEQLLILAEEFAAGDFRINVRNVRSADDPFALLTRAHELAAADAAADEGAAEESGP